MRNQRTVIVASIMLIIISGVGILKLKVNTFLIDDIPQSHPMKVDFMFFDELARGYDE